MKSKFILTALICFLLTSFQAEAQTGDFRIFGRITTIENQTHTGYITWGKDKMFWIDFFSASKPNNPYRHYFDRNSGVLFQNNGVTTDQPVIHGFTCRFGNIKKIRITGRNQIELQVKDGNSIELDKGSFNDIGCSIAVYSSDYGVTKLPWEKISEIEFMASDQPTDVKYNIPITGIVKTNQGIYKGFVQWDSDEKNHEGTLDGKSQNGDISITFGHIRRIEKKNNSCDVALFSGREMNVWGSNDVNSQNRGVLVNMPGVGLVTIPWGNFESFEAVDLKDIKYLSYKDFKKPTRIQGTIQTQKGETFAGIMAYDLDEAMDFEVLDGKNDNITYTIPFKFIKTIEPKNYRYSFVTLKNGSALSLGDNVDVNYDNSGILLFQKSDEPMYFTWKSIKKITLD